MYRHVVATFVLFGLAGFSLAPALAGVRAPVVSLDSLLREMVDRNAVARLPEFPFICKQASSHDRRKTDPSNPKTWHTNEDHDQFIRTEMHDGRKEWVMMDASGPGAIVRIWTPLDARLDKAMVRFYLDGQPAPVIVERWNDFVSGHTWVKPPLAFIAWPDDKTQRGVGGDCYLPIPYAKSCKVTLDARPFYYHFNYREYATGTRVESFRAADCKEVENPLTAIAHYPFHEKDSAPNEKFALPGWRKTSAHVPPGKELSIELPQPTSDGGVVTQLSVWIDAARDEEVLRSTVVEATFDGEKTIWCPASEFFGAGVRPGKFYDWWREVDSTDAPIQLNVLQTDHIHHLYDFKDQGEGYLTARWVMPYQHSGRIALKNLGKSSAKLGLYVDCKEWKWDDRSLHFHANWRCQRDLKTRPMSDWNYLEAKGQGRYVGDTLTVFSPVKAWYGEGDERIYYDGAALPAHIGTGTEDYYGYAWGMAEEFSSPFMSMPHRDRPGRDDWRGYTTTSRLRLLDDIPFQSSLKVDMEIWNWADTKVDYAVGTFWYARPGATDNRPPQPAEAAAPVRPGSGNFRVPGAIECERLPIVAKSSGTVTEVQSAGLSQGEWSGDAQLFVRGNKGGDFVELAIPAPDDKPRRLVLHATKSWDYGYLRFSVNGQNAGVDYDAYHATAIPSGPISLGVFKPRDGKFLLRVEVVGANLASKGTRSYFGLDCVVLGTP